ncbi:hypothetical protein FACS1894199_07660 [Bacteroidia bacterium]|nr:hypothetical protein FACS1894199_07660 [Bacteroidia bacterium]
MGGSSQATLIATVHPATATNKTVSWSSSNTGVATVSASGVVTAKAAGTTRITVTTTDGSYKAYCDVTVTATVANVILNPTTLSLIDIGSTRQLTATVNPTNANGNVRWTSNNTNVVTVSATGLVTAIGVGTATITAMADDGSNKYATCNVTVTIAVRGITLNKNSGAIVGIGATTLLTATVLPENASNKNFTWASSNPAVATVSGGLVTARGAGTTTITATTADGNFKATCVVTVTIAVTGITVSPTSIAPLPVGQTSQLTATVLPTAASNKTVQWNSSNPTVATVNSSGLVTANSAGYVSITARTEDGSYTATCGVTVVVLATGVTLSENAYTLFMGGVEQFTLIPTVEPGNASNKGVSWSSSNPSVATVSDDGLVTAQSAGTANITVTTVDGNYTATCVLTVNTAVTDVILNKDNTEIHIGSTEKLLATVVPANATNQSVTWNSLYPSIASVGNDGTVTAHIAGYTVVYVTTDDGLYMDACQVRVTTPATSVTLDKVVDTLILSTKLQGQLIATVVPAETTYPTVQWSSSNTGVATVNTSGVITAVSAGTTTITATTTDGSNKTATCDVTVTTAVTSVDVQSTAVVAVGGNANSTGGPEQVQLLYTVYPVNATNKDVTWMSDDPTVATVNTNGVVTAKSDGTVDIVVATQDGNYKDTCIVTVTTAVRGVSLNDSMWLQVPHTEYLTASVMPTNASIQDISWQSANPGVASVHPSSGLVTAITNGTTNIIVTTTDGSYKDTCAVRVYAQYHPVTGVSLNKSVDTLVVDEMEQLFSTVSPVNATNLKLRWSSDDENIAVVDSLTGKVTAKTVGTANITVKAHTENFVGAHSPADEEDVCTVTVIPIPVSAIKLDQTSIALVIATHSQHTLHHTALPLKAANRDVTWKSDNEGVATVNSSGVVTATGRGTATIIATTDTANDAYYKTPHSTTCQVKVTVAVTGVEVTPSSTALIVGGTPSQFTPTATVLPDTATNQALTWSSRNPTVATVNASTGLVTAKTNGTTYIIATTADGGYKDSCTVTVTTAALGVSTPSTAALSIGGGANSIGGPGQLSLPHTVLPSTASNKNITWTSDNPTVATVSASGEVTANTMGDANIIVTTADGGHIDTCVVTVTTAVKGISLSSTSSALVVGGTNSQLTLTAFIIPDTATDQTVMWSSSDRSVAMVSPSISDPSIGNQTTVFARSNGTATITATTKDGQETATCTISVTTAAQGITINKSAISLALGGIEQTTLTATVQPSTANNKDFTWTSDDITVARVNSSGLVEAYGEGVANIVATTDDGGHTDTCVVTVSIAVTGITLDEATASFIVGLDGPLQLTPTVLPTDATNQDIEWSSSDESIATVDANGVVTAIGSGTTTITATTVDGGKTAVCKVTSTILVTGVNIQPTVALAIGGTEQLVLSATIHPTTATNKAITWSSDNPSIATVDTDNGTIRAKAEGTANITATTADGNFTATCLVTVTIAVKSISLNINAVSITGINNTAELHHTIQPFNASNQTVTWSSSNAAIAIVDNAGGITAKGPGKATITVTTADGNKNANATVTVIVPVTGITLNQASHTMYTGLTQQLIATILPGNATTKTVKWSSSSNSIATVSADGLITAKSDGKTTITAVTTDGNYKATCELTVLLNTDNDLTTLTFRTPSKTLQPTPAFSHKQTAYTVTLPCDENSLTISASPPLYGSVTFEHASTDGQVELTVPGDTTIIIHSHSNSGATKDYTITVVRPFDASLIKQLWTDVLAVDLAAAARYGYTFDTFQWTKDDGKGRGAENIRGATSSYYSFDYYPTALYSVKLTSADSGKIVPPVCPTRVVTITEFKVFPNPATSTLTVTNIDWPTTFDIDVFDMSGRLVKKFNSTGVQTVIDLSDCAKGLYIVRVGSKHSAQIELID